MTDLFDEVVRESKEESRVALLQRWLPLVTVFVIIGAVLITFLSWRGAKMEEYNQRVGDVAFELLENAQNGESINHRQNLEQLIQNSDGKHSEIIKFIQVNKHLESGIDQAMIALEEMANDQGVSLISRSYAKLIWISLVLQQGVDDLQNKAKAIAYFDSFVSESQPFYFNVSLLKALFYMQCGQYDIARSSAQNILQSQIAPQIVKEQAYAIISDLDRQQKQPN